MFDKSKFSFSYTLFFSLAAFLILPLDHVTAGNWNTGTKTERSKVSDGIYIERKINKKTGKVESEITLIQTSNGYFQAEKKADGSWGLSAEGQAEQNAAATSGGAGAAGGGGGC
jgi:hypothetical protein